MDDLWIWFVDICSALDDNRAIAQQLEDIATYMYLELLAIGQCYWSHELHSAALRNIVSFT